MELRLCTVVGWFCSPARNIPPQISLHDLPYMRKCLRQVSLNKVAFLLPLQKSRIQTCGCYCPQYLCWFRILDECSPNKHGQGMILVRPSRLLSWVLSTLGQCFVSFQPVSQGGPQALGPWNFDLLFFPAFRASEFFFFQLSYKMEEGSKLGWKTTNFERLLIKNALHCKNPSQYNWLDDISPQTSTAPQRQTTRGDTHPEPKFRPPSTSKWAKGSQKT